MARRKMPNPSDDDYPGPPAVTVDAEKYWRDRIRLNILSIYLAWGQLAEEDCAIRAGYSLEEVQQDGFVRVEAQKARSIGLVAMMEIQPSQLFASEILNNFAALIRERDTSPWPSDRIKAAMELNKLAGYPKIAVAFDPKDIAEQEMMTWTKQEVIAYMKSGGTEFPKRRKGLGVFQPQEAEAVEDRPTATAQEIEQMIQGAEDDEAEDPEDEGEGDVGMLAG